MQATQLPKEMVRGLRRVTAGIQASDGDGVNLTRMIGSPELNRLDPFLLFDVFASDRPDDYIGGFPAHPHRGFETVTYLLAGRLRHRDSAGHEGVIEPGGVQWMTAGRGIVHSEMPEQENGLLQGFQLWVNLPAREKMCAPAYQEFNAEDLAVAYEPGGIQVRVIAGRSDGGLTGPVINHHVSPLFMDISLPAGQTFEQGVDAGDNAFVYVIDGAVAVGASERDLESRELGILQHGERVRLRAQRAARFLLVAAQPLREPVARGGPFVMNTREEVMQAFEDYRNNQFQDQ